MKHTLKKASLALIPGLLALTACQVGVGFGAATPSGTPSAAPTASSPPVGTPSVAPSGTPASTPSGDPSPAPSAQAPVPFTVLLDQNSPAAEEEKTLVIDNQSAFDQFWTRHGGTQAKPTVDFAQNNILAVYRPDAPYVGLGYEITSVTQANRIVTVHYHQRAQKDGMVYLPTISQTIHAVSIPLSKQSGAYDSVNFVEDQP